jgi:hypothetical protein
VVQGNRKQYKGEKFRPYTLQFSTQKTRQTAELFKLRYLYAIACCGASHWSSESMQGFLMGLQVWLTELKYMHAQDKCEGYIASLQDTPHEPGDDL